MNASGEDLHTMLADVSGTSVHRLRITKGSDRSVVPNTKGTTIEETGLRESSVIHIKDLGTSIITISDIGGAQERVGMG